MPNKSTSLNNYYISDYEPPPVAPLIYLVHSATVLALRAILKKVLSMRCWNCRLPEPAPGRAPQTDFDHTSREE